MNNKIDNFNFQEILDLCEAYYKIKNSSIVTSNEELLSLLLCCSINNNCKDDCNNNKVNFSEVAKSINQY